MDVDASLGPASIVSIAANTRTLVPIKMIAEGFLISDSSRMRLT